MSKYTASIGPANATKSTKTGSTKSTPSLPNLQVTVGSTIDGHHAGIRVVLIASDVSITNSPRGSPLERLSQRFGWTLPTVRKVGTVVSWRTDRSASNTPTVVSLVCSQTYGAPTTNDSPLKREQSLHKAFSALVAMLSVDGMKTPAGIPRVIVEFSLSPIVRPGAISIGALISVAMTHPDLHILAVAPESTIYIPTGPMLSDDILKRWQQHLTLLSSLVTIDAHSATGTTRTSRYCTPSSVTSSCPPLDITEKLTFARCDTELLRDAMQHVQQKARLQDVNIADEWEMVDAIGDPQMVDITDDDGDAENDVTVLTDTAESDVDGVSLDLGDDEGATQQVAVPERYDSDVLSLAEYLQAEVPAGWESFFELVIDDEDTGIPHISAVLAERNQVTEIYPPMHSMFAAFDCCRLEDIKVLILGQDPYHQPDQATGMAFAVAPGVLPPPSLQNIFLELEADGFTIADKTSGDLTTWVSQGVFLLNTALTVEDSTADSHSKLWEDFTLSLMGYLNANLKGYVAILWGNKAQKFSTHLSHAKIVSTSHPSPLSAYRGFLGSRCFSKANVLLKSMKKEPIDWSL